jgi:acetyl esterase/lipase
MRIVPGVERDECLLREYDCKHTIADNISRVLHEAIPLYIQHFIRDYGGVAWINNTTAVIVGGLLCLSRPSLLVEYIRLSWSTRRIVYDKLNRDHFIDVMDMSSTSADADGMKTRALVFVYGGAWGSGHTWMYRLCAANAAKCLRASHAILVEYSTFPSARIDDQVVAVKKSINFVRDNPSIVFPTESPFKDHETCEIILMGHSSGANVASLCLHQYAGSFTRCVDVFIASAGVYDISKHYEWERARGLHEISPMSPAARGFNGFGRFSPTLLTDNLLQDSLSSYYPKVLFLHGLRDFTVPVTSSIEYARALKSKGVDIYAALPDYDHMDPILELTLSSQSTTGKLIQEFIEMITTDL